MYMLNKKILITIFALIFSFSLTYAQTTENNPITDFLTPKDFNELKYSRQGIFGCTGGKYAPVGLQGPTGPFVPVFDEAVHSQVQLSTYKECVLDPLMSHIANSALANTIATQLDMVNKSDLVVKDINEHLTDVSKKATVDFINNVCPEKIKSEYVNDICGLIASEAQKNFSDPYKGLKCDVDPNYLKKFNSGEPVPSSVQWQIISQPGCSKLTAYTGAKAALNDKIQSEIQKELFNIQDGFKPQTTEVEQSYIGPDGQTHTETKKIVVTPASVVANLTNLALGSGIRKLENAKRIDELVQSFLANLSNRVLDASKQGLYGINKALGDSSISYLSRLVKQEKDAATQFRSMVGGMSLKGMLDTEIKYLEQKQKFAELLLNAIHDIRANEQQCFDQKIIKGARQYLTNQLSAELCGSSSSTTTSCTTKDSSVSIEKLPGFVDVYEKTEGNKVFHGSLVFAGNNVQSGNSTITFVNENGDASSVNFVASSNWSVESNTENIPEGTMAITATMPNGGLATTTLYKKTIAGIPVIVLPIKRYLMKITATASKEGDYGQIRTASKDVTIQIDRRYSNIYTGANSSLIQTLEKTLGDIKQSTYVIKALYSIAQDAKDNPDLATWKIDQLVNKNIPHTEGQLRKAKDDVVNATGNLDALVKDILKNDWEANRSGWCNPEGWSEFKI